MSDLTTRLQDAAKAAIADIAPTIEAAGPRLHTLTVEVELLRGKPVEARSWIERRVNVGKVLGVKG